MRIADVQAKLSQMAREALVKSQGETGAEGMLAFGRYLGLRDANLAVLKMMADDIEKRITRIKTNDAVTDVKAGRAWPADYMARVWGES